jgi:opacity protein-like surface antigen
MQSKIITSVRLSGSGYKLEKINLKIVSKSTFQSLRGTKQSLLLYLFLLFTICSFSQTKYGLKGGLNFTDTTTGVTFMGQSYGINTSPKTSFYLGGFVEYPLNKKGNLFLVPELLYNQNGTTIDPKTTANDQDIDYTSNGGKIAISQLNLPILLQFTTPKKISFLGGIYIGTISGIKATNNNGTTSTSTNYNSFDYGFIIGAKYNFQKNMFAEFRYNRGLQDIDKSYGETPYGNIESFYYNRTIHIGIGYKLN